MGVSQYKKALRFSVLYQNPLMHILLICIVALIAYSNTFHLPFQFDDKVNIVKNTSLRDLGNFWPPAGSRWLGYLTFALNYHLGGLHTTGYHVVNILIHISTAVLVYWFVHLTFETPFMKSSASGVAISEKTVKLAALLSALVFVSHPLQTQAVTYIIQRFESLAALLYLFAMIMFIKARLLQTSVRDGGGRLQIRAALLYLLFLFFAVLAMKTKETAFTLPLMIILYEFSFFHQAGNPAGRPSLFRKALYLLPIAALLLIIPLGLDRWEKASDILSLTPSAIGTNIISQHDYLLTQFRVIVTYLRLTVLPVNQSFDYDYPLYSTFLASDVVVSFLVLLMIVSLGVYLFYRSASSWSYFRLASFGIAWFFITLSVTSSFIPLTDIIFEHRLYLPSIGFIIAVVTGFTCYLDSRLADSFHGKKIVVVVLVAVVLSFSYATYLRNNVWINEAALWQDVVEKNPNNPRGYNMLGIYYSNNGDIDRALSLFSVAIQRRPQYAEAHVNLGNMYLRKGMLEAALREFMIALNLRSLDAIDQASLYVSIGNYYLKKSLPGKAIEYFKLALELMPDEAGIYIGLGNAYKDLGIMDRAAEYFARAERLSYRQ